jgi:6-phosphogluconolactonase
MSVFAVGNYGLEGIEFYSFQNGTISLIGSSTPSENPSYLYLHDNVLYAVLETQTYRGENGGAVASFQLEDGEWKRTSVQNTFGKDPCHLITDPNRKWLFCANYSEGSVSVFPLNPDGTIEPICCHQIHSGSGPHPIRQTQAHVHFLSFTPDGEYLCAIDLGMDQIVGYLIQENENSDILCPAFTSQLAPQIGPRHLVFSPDGNYAYVIGELSNTITVMRYLGKEGLKILETIPIEFESAGVDSTSAAIRMTKDGSYLYASVRGSNQIAVFSVCKNSGMITQIQTISSFGLVPRDIALSPDEKWLLCANQDSKELSLFLREETTGMLSHASHFPCEGKPVCICFM